MFFNVHGSFSCNFSNKIKAISCREIQDLSEMIHIFKQRSLTKYPDCDEENLEYLEFVFYKIKVSILEDVYPRNPADLFSILLSEMGQMRNPMYQRSSDLMSSDVEILLDLDEIRVDLLKLDVVIKELIEKITKDLIYEESYAKYLLRRVSIKKL